MRVTPLLLVMLCVWLATAPARADCRASASGRISVSVRLSPISGLGCFSAVALHDGGLCEGPAVARATLHCSRARRMMPTDSGRLVALLAPRGSRPEWDIVHVYELDADRVRVRSIRLRELPGFATSAPHPRLTLDASGLRLDGGAPLAMSTLEALGRPTRE